MKVRPRKKTGASGDAVGNEGENAHCECIWLCIKLLADRALLHSEGVGGLAMAISNVLAC